MLIVVIDSYRYNEIETDPLARASETNASPLSLLSLLVYSLIRLLRCITVHRDAVCDYRWSNPLEKQEKRGEKTGQSK